MKTKRLDSIVLAFYILSGIASYTNYSIIRYPLLLTGILIQVIYYFIKNKPIYIIKLKSYDYLYLSFVLISGLASIYTMSYELLFGSILMLVLYLSFRFFFKGTDIYSNLYFTSVIITLFSVISLMITPVRLNSYSGIYLNPNSLGTLSVTAFSSALIVFYKNLESKIKRTVPIYLLLVFSSFMIIISSSRTSFIALIAQILLIIFFLIIEKKMKISKVFLLTLIISFIIIISPMRTIINDAIISKFIHKSNDLLDGRSFVWMETIKDVKIFGHGRNYFSKFGLGSHNTFISIMGQYGLLSFSVFTLFFISILIKTWILTPSKRSYLIWAPLSLFLILSFGEGMINSPSMIVLFYVIFNNNTRV